MGFEVVDARIVAQAGQQCPSPLVLVHVILAFHVQLVAPRTEAQPGTQREIFLYRQLIIQPQNAAGIVDARAETDIAEGGAGVVPMPMRPHRHIYRVFTPLPAEGNSAGKQQQYQNQTLRHNSR